MGNADEYSQLAGFSEDHARILSELSESPEKAAYVFHAAYRLRILLDRYSADEVIIPGIERTWATIEKAGLIEAVSGISDNVPSDRIIELMQSSFEEAPRGVDMSLQYPQPGRGMHEPRSALFASIVLTAMNALIAQEKAPQQVSFDDLQVVMEYALRRVAQRQFDSLNGINDGQSALQKLAREAARSGEELSSLMVRLLH